MNEFRVKMHENGRIVIPAACRHLLHLKPGEELVLRVEDMDTGIPEYIAENMTKEIISDIVLFDDDQAIMTASLTFGDRACLARSIPMSKSLNKK